MTDDDIKAIARVHGWNGAEGQLYFADDDLLDFARAILSAAHMVPLSDDGTMVWIEGEGGVMLCRCECASSVEIPHDSTPLPWRITEPGEKKGPREIVGANGATVARLTALDLPNAELIVPSVNRNKKCL